MFIFVFLVYRSFGNNDQDDFRVVAGILRLSTKYIIDPLREKALEHLSVVWPRTLRAWDLREDLARSYEMEATDSSHLYPHPIVRCVLFFDHVFITAISPVFGGSRLLSTLHEK